MTTIPDYELLKDAYAIIDGIPDKAISFGRPCGIRGRAIDDGTVCSPAGWLALHPMFAKLGLSITDDGSLLEFNGEAMDPVKAMAAVLRLPEEEAAQLFGERRFFVADNAATDASDKTLWQTRVRHHIHNRALADTITTMVMAPAVTLAKIADAIEGEPT